MAIGDSGGRSAGNRTGDGARRRSTPRERAQIDPPWDEPSRGEKWFTVAAWLSLIGFWIIGAVLICVWWGLI